MAASTKHLSPAAAASPGGVPGPDPTLVSVVIPVLNCAATLPAQLDALARQTYRGSWEVVVADNGSTDGSPELIMQWADRLPRLQIVDASARRGISAARNAGVAAAQGELLAICDGGDIVDDGWLAALVLATSSADVVGGRLDDTRLNDPDTVSRHAGRPPGLRRPLGYLPYAPGGNCCIRREVFRFAGGWDDQCMWAEDIEFSWRAQIAGFRLTYSPNAVLYRRQRSTTWGTARTMFRNGMAIARLARTYRPHGAPPVMRGELRSWIRIILRTGDLARFEKRWLQVRRIAYHLEGCLRVPLAPPLMD